MNQESQSRWSRNLQQHASAEIMNKYFTDDLLHTMLLLLLSNTSILSEFHITIGTITILFFEMNGLDMGLKTTNYILFTRILSEFLFLSSYFSL